VRQTKPDSALNEVEKVQKIMRGFLHAINRLRTQLTGRHRFAAAARSGTLLSFAFTAHGATFTTMAAPRFSTWVVEGGVETRPGLVFIPVRNFSNAPHRNPCDVRDMLGGSWWRGSSWPHGPMRHWFSESVELAAPPGGVAQRERGIGESGRGTGPSGSESEERRVRVL
jgi:hypothetical protein